MNEQLENIKKYGVPIHSNMTVEQLSESWEGTSQQVKRKNPGITRQLKALQKASKLESTLLQAFVVNKKIADATKQAIQVASGTMVGQLQLPVQTLQEEASKKVLQEQSTAFDKLKQSILE